MNKGTISRILHNETYVGDKLLQKKAPRNYLTKKPDPNVEHESNYLTDDHEAIVDRDTWKKVQAKLEVGRKQRESGWTPIGNSHFLYGRIFCANCGVPYSRRTFRESQKKDEEGSTYKVWCCRERVKGKKGNGCKNSIIREEMLLEMICIQLGWEWNGAEQFPAERFLREIERVEIGDGIQIKRKETA